MKWERTKSHLNLSFGWSWFGKLCAFYRADTVMRRKSWNFVWNFQSNIAKGGGGEVCYHPKWEQMKKKYFSIVRFRHTKNFLFNIVDELKAARNVCHVKTTSQDCCCCCCWYRRHRLPALHFFCSLYFLFRVLFTLRRNDEFRMDIE